MHRTTYDLWEPNRRYWLRRIDIRTDQWRDEQPINGERIVTIKAPSKGHQVAVIVGR